LAAPDESPPTTFPADLPLQEVEFGMLGHIDRAEIPGLCVRLQVLAALVAAPRLVCDVGEIVEPDAVTVDALARLQLTARRLGREVRIRHASAELQELLTLMGLSGVVPLSAESRLEVGREAEEREVGRRVEEEADPADPPT
jgi:ABC-type transporter Mla MlaB component